MNSRDRNGLYGGGNIRPCGSDSKCDSRSRRIDTTRAVASSGSDMNAISRPKNLGSTYARMRYAKIVSMLVICAAATIVVSAIAHASVDTEKAAAPPIALADLPNIPYLLWGYTTDALGNPYECYVTITNLRTGEVNTTNSFIVPPWPLDGYYEFDLANGPLLGYLVGDMYNVTAVSAVSGTIGWNESAVPGGGSMWMDVTLTETVIPEFPMVIVPVTGMLALFVVMRLKRRGEDQ